MVVTLAALILCCQRLRRNKFESQRYCETLPAVMAGTQAATKHCLRRRSKPQVDAAALARNFKNCDGGYSGCNVGLLTAEQRAVVEQSAGRRNAYNCAHGFSGCVPNAVSASAPRANTLPKSAAVRREPAAVSPSSSLGQPSANSLAAYDRTTETVATPATLVVAPAVAGCAENGSCYGDISAATGRAKTTHVNGYTRSDGTYVRGHYRSK